MLDSILSVKFSVLFLTLFMLLSKANAQVAFDMTHLDSSVGLSGGSVTSIVQDKQGFIWIGTKRGLNRYDGHTFTTFETGLASKDISGLLVDNKGDLWIGTVGGGLARYHILSRSFETFTHRPNRKSTISSNEVTSIFEDSSNRLWIGTEQGLNLYRGDSTFNQVPSHANAKLPIRCIAEDTSGGLWVGTFGYGLYTLKQGATEVLLKIPKQQLSANFILTINPHPVYGLIVGTRDNGLFRLKPPKTLFTSIFTDLMQAFDRPPIIRTIQQDKHNNLWIGTDGDGLLYLKIKDEDQVKAHWFNASGQLAGNAINTTFEDHLGNIWVATAWNGISVIEKDHANIRRFSSDSTSARGTPVLSVHSIKNELWMGTDGNGISRINRDSGKITPVQPLKGKRVQVISPRADGTYWIGTYSGGIALLCPQKGRHRRYEHQIGQPGSLSFNDVRGIIEKPGTDSVWVATWGGGLNLFHLKDKTFTHFQTGADSTHSISSNNLSSLVQGGDGRLWMTTFGGGVNVFNPKNGKFKSYRHRQENTQSLSSDNTLTLFEDHLGAIWVGTWNKGINRLDPATGKVERFAHHELLQDRTVTAIREDDDGNIWFSTKNGIVVFDRTEQQFRSFDELKGEYHINSAFKDENGLLYFGGIEGVVRFDPKKIRQSPSTDRPKVILTDFKLFNRSVRVEVNGILARPIGVTKSILLEHNENNITFEFTTLDFPSSATYEFAVKLEGFDNEWKAIGWQRAATFTNLPPGEYYFKVKNRFPGGQWSTNSTDIAIEVLKPLWMTWWAYTGYVLLFMLFLWLFRRWTLAWEKMQSQLKLEKAIHEKDRELHQVKQRFFNNISHEIRTPVTLMLAAANRIMDEVIVNQRLSTHLLSLRKNGDFLLQLVNELLEFRKLEANQVRLKVSKTNLSDFVREIYLSFKGLADKRKIQFSFEITDATRCFWIDVIQMEKVIYNLLNNSFKHVPDSGQIAVKVSFDDQNAFVSIQDNGKGIAPDQLKNIFKRFYQIKEDKRNASEGFGIGMSIVKEIVHLHKGEISVDSTLNEGSRFVIKLLQGHFHFDEKDKVVQHPLIEDKTRQQETAPKEYEKTEEKNEEIKVLVVEDNQELKNYLKTLLEPRYGVQSAQNGAEGIEVALREIPDLIISDVLMPVKDGVELTIELKSNKATCHIPIILLTARTGVIYKKEGFDIGADDYITKPFNEPLLLARIKNLIQSRKQVWERLNVKAIAAPKALGINPLDEEFLQNLTRLIESNIAENNLSPEFLSDQLAMSHSVIYKKLKHLTGQSIVEFIRDFKLKRGAELILKYKYPIEEACYKAGFADRRYFSRAFKKKFGLTPSDYAKKGEKLV